MPTSPKVEDRHRKAAKDFVLRFAATDRGPIASFGTRAVAQAFADTEARVLAEVADALRTAVTGLYDEWRKLGRSDAPWPTWPDYLADWLVRGSWRGETTE